MTASSIVRALSAIILVAAFSACDDPTDPVANEQELITDVTITLTPVGGGAAIVSTIADPDGAGPNPPNAQTAAIALEPGVTYDGEIEFLDRQNPSAVEDITAEVAEEADEHRVFYTVNGLTGVTVPDASMDTDSNGAPVGLIFQVVVDAGAASGSGSIRVVLSHYDDAPKGNGSVPSDETDVDVTFTASVN
ncbi:MAG: type 1 periplasmic binding fold superfamily protein [Longimicrobiales bacterium]